MAMDANEQYMELYQIQDTVEKIDIAVKKFSNGEMSAKAIRMLYESLPTKEKCTLLNKVYAEGVRDSNMKRLPPSILMPEQIRIDNSAGGILAVLLGKYELINEYQNSKSQDKFARIRNVIENFKKTNLKRMNLITWDVTNFIEKETIRAFFEEFLMEKAHDVSLLGLPKNMTIGVELEVIGMTKKQLNDFMSMTELSYLDDFHIKRDSSVKEKGGKHGVEVTSPVLTDDEESWRKLDTACRFIRALGGRPNKTCGGHIHLGTNFLGLDTQAWRNFRDLWAEAEPLIYMMANKRGEKPREGVAKYSPPVGQKMSEFDFDSISLTTEDDLEQLRDMLDSRYASYNPTNIGNSDKNTEESRVHNSTIDFDILRENILLFGKMHKICKLRAIDPSIKQKEWDDFFEKDLEEKEKVIRFLDLVFDSEKEKDIFYRRWSSLAGQYINVYFSNLTYKKQFWPELPEDKKEGYGKAKKEYGVQKECGVKGETGGDMDVD